MGAGLAADGNDNGQIDPGDYGVWRANFGRTAGIGAENQANSSGEGAVPEPAAVGLLLATLFCLAVRQRPRN
jgi:hypothetical protein